MGHQGLAATVGLGYLSIEGDAYQHRYPLLSAVAFHTLVSRPIAVDHYAERNADLSRYLNGDRQVAEPEGGRLRDEKAEVAPPDRLDDGT